MWLGIEEVLKKPITYSDFKNEMLSLEHLAHMNPVLDDIKKEELINILS